MSTPTDCINPTQVSDFANKDVTRIIGKIAEVLALRSPFMDILNGGTLPNVSDVVRSVVQERAVVAASLAKPVFTNDVSMCGAAAGQDQVGSTEYSYQLQSLRGFGPKVCVKTSRTAFKDSYLRAQQSMEKSILQIMNSDIRSTLHMRSGVKFVCRNDQAFSTLLTGGSQQIDTQFYQSLPNAPLSFKTLYKLGITLREELLADPFESETGAMFKFIGGAEIVERLRNDLDVKVDLNYLTTGRYELGGKTLQGYTFQGPYRGFVFGIDQRPLRATGFDDNGDLVLVEPEVSVAVTKGVASRVNPAWLSAHYEIAFVLCANSFERLVPEQYTGEGTFKFNPQLAMGELMWHYVIDNCDNVYGDFGWHRYQISRAYRPIRPHAVIPILFQRCNYDLGLTTCSSTSSGL